MEFNQIYNMDCVEGMKQLPDNCIDLIVTSPPYDHIRDYNSFHCDLHLVGIEIQRILKDGGICVMVIQDQTKGVKSGTSFRTIVDWMDIGLGLWECCIYQRSATPGAWWDKRFRVDHEYIPIFLKGKRPQYFNKEHMKIPNPNSGKSGGSIRNTAGELIPVTGISPTTKCCGTVMSYASSSREGNGNNDKISHKLKLQHPATFPDKLAADFIEAFTQEGMVVCDPFAGSGVTLLEAKNLLRTYMGFEISTEYCRLAEERVGHAAASSIIEASASSI